LMETYYTITEGGRICGEMTTCPQLARYMSLGNVSMSLGTCADHNYSTTCDPLSSAFTQSAMHAYYNCKESMIDSSHSEENKYAMVYYSSDDYDCALGDPVMETYFHIESDESGRTCREMTMCPQLAQELLMSNITMSLGTCAGHNYSTTCEGLSSKFTQFAIPFYYDCKESKWDEQSSEENSHAMAYYFSDDYDCGLDRTGYGHECVGYNAVDSDFDESDHMPDGSAVECASRCTGDCTAFYWNRQSGCDFFTGAVMRQSLSSSYQDNRGCFQRVPDSQEICSWSSDAPDAGEGWIVECGKLCHVSDSRTGPARLEWDAPWRMGVTIKECGDLCKNAGDCDAFHYNPQNGGSCQLLPGFIVGTKTDSIPTYIGGACVHKGIREDSGSSALTLRLSFFALTMLLFFA